MKAAAALFLLSTFPAGAMAAETDEILAAVLKQAAVSARAQKAWPTIISAKTSGGAEQAAREWALAGRGRVIAGELSDSYISVNQQRSALPQKLAARVRAVDVDQYRSGSSFDWAAIERDYEGTRSIVVLSLPGVDRLGTYALVRADVIKREGGATTSFYDLEKRADGKWRITRMTPVGAATRAATESRGQ